MAVAAAAALMFAASTPPAVAASTTPDTLSHEEALHIDAGIYAETFGVSPEEALQRLNAQEVAGALILDIAAAAGDRFAGAWIEHEPAWSVQIRLTEGPAHPTVEHLAGNSDLPVHVKYDREHSRSDLVAEADRILASSVTRAAGVDGVWVDERTSEVVIEVHDNAAADPLTSLRTVVPIRVELTESPLRNENVGGVPTTSCTTGFTVRTPSGVSGFTTAGHCSNTQSYALTPNGTPSYNSTYVGGLDSATTDIQWHTPNSHTAQNTFYGSSALATTRQVGTAVAMVGSSLCHRGKTSGYSCGQVTSTAYATPAGCGTGSCSAVFVRVQGISLQTGSGDSGGPWFSGGTAYGVHKSGTGGGNATAAFTPIARLSGLGVVLLL